jgi:transposase
MKTYPAEFRERALAALDRGRPLAEAAAWFGVGTATLKRWRRRRRETGGVTAAPKPGRPPRVGPDRFADLASQVRATPDATLPEHCAAWEAATGARVSPATMCRLLRRLGLPLKKSASSRPSGTRPPAPPGGPRRRGSTRPTSSSSTRRAPTPR